jgi:hypothetical protein
VDDRQKAMKYRERARDTIIAAGKIKHEEQRRMMLAIAATYHRLAEQMERSEP